MVWRYNKSGVSYNADFTITTLSKSINQRDLKNGAVVAPYFFGSQGEGRTRNTCLPPVVIAGAIPTGTLEMGTGISREDCGIPDIDTRFPLIASTTTLYTPEIEFDQSISMPLLASTTELYTPVVDKEIQIPFLASTTTLYTPEIEFDQSISMPLLASTTELYTPSFGTIIEMPLLASTTQLYTPVINKEIQIPFLASTTTLYTPELRTSYTLSGSLIPSSVAMYTPTVSVVGETEYYTQILSASNPNNGTPMHVGSLYLDAQTYTTIGALVNELQYGAGSEMFVEFKRFTDGSNLTTLFGTIVSGYQYVTQSNVTVSTADWYDIYISASHFGIGFTTSSIRGVYYEI